MANSKLRSSALVPLSKVPRVPRHLSKSKSPVKATRKQSCNSVSPRDKVRSKAKKHPRRSLMRAGLSTTVMRSPKKMNLAKLKVSLKSPKLKKGVPKSQGGAGKIKLIDANPLKRFKGSGGGGGGGTPVLFLSKGSSKHGISKKKAVKSSVLPYKKLYGWKNGQLDPRFMTMPKSRAHEGVDFFYNLGQRVPRPEPEPDVSERPRGGGGEGLTGGTGGGRLKAGGLGAGVTDGPKLMRGGIDLAEAPRGTELKRTGLTRPEELRVLSPSSVLFNRATLAAMDIVVPLSNHLPIIDFISTTEFQDMHANRKNPRRLDR